MYSYTSAHRRGGSKKNPKNSDLVAIIFDNAVVAVAVLVFALLASQASANEKPISCRACEHTRRAFGYYLLLLI